MAFQTVKIPDWAYENALAARHELVHRGLGALPPALLHPDRCPHCGADLAVESKASRHVQCATCGYRQAEPGTEGDPTAALGLGFILGLGVAALFAAIGSKGTDRTRAREFAKLRQALAALRGRADAPPSRAEIDHEVRKARDQRTRT